MAAREAIIEMFGAENGQTDEEDERWITHYSSNHQILLVGEGDFSFSLSLANAFASASNMCASSLDSYDDLKRKYKNAVSNLVNLRILGATLLHGVDATKMDHHTDLANRKFDRIIFNFPHAGFYGKEDNLHMIQLHKKLVQGFFRSASGMLRVNGEIHVNHKTGSPYCLWNLEKLATKSSLALIQRVGFYIEDYPGYQNKRGGGSDCDVPFHLGESSTFKFSFNPRANKVPNGLGSTHKKSQHNLAVPLPMQPWSISDFNYPQRNHIVNHIPIIFGLPPTIPNGNQYTRGSDTNLNGLVPTYQRNRYGVEYPERLCSAFGDRNLNSLVRTYETNSYGVEYPDNIRSYHDASLARDYVLGRPRSGLDRQMVETELPRTLNGNSHYMHDHELRHTSNSKPLLRREVACQAYRPNAPDSRGVLRL